MLLYILIYSYTSIQRPECMNNDTLCPNLLSVNNLIPMTSLIPDDRPNETCGVMFLICLPPSLCMLLDI